VSYFRGRSEGWETGRPPFRSIVYSELWPGIDLVFTGEPERLKHEFRIRPGADPDRIRLAYRGVTGLSRGVGGSLVAETPAGILEDAAPIAYQFEESDRARTDVRVEYRWTAPTDDGSFGYGFELAEYDRTRPLILDPEMFVYCGYLGGFDADEAAAIAIDEEGNIYLGGRTQTDETDFPVTVGPDLTYDGQVDAFVAKLAPDGRTLLYVGYIGGDDFDTLSSIAVDSEGRLYVAGQTNSREASFPVKVGPDLLHNGSSDAWVARVNAGGTDLDYCGYVGGLAVEEVGPGSITVDDSGRAILAGMTWSDETIVRARDIIARYPEPRSAIMPLLYLAMLQPERVTDSLLAYQIAKRGSSLRVQAEAVRWARRGARINAISPGIVATPLSRKELSGPNSREYRRMIEACVAGRAGTPDEVGGVGALLMGPEGAFISGSDFLMDGGVTAAYRYGDLAPKE